MVVGSQAGGILGPDVLGSWVSSALKSGSLEVRRSWGPGVLGLEVLAL